MTAVDNVRYRHLQRIAERQQRRWSAEQRQILQNDTLRAFWEGLDAREQARWTALDALLDENEH